MNETQIKTHDFEEAKLALKKFSEETTPELSFTIVPDKKGTGQRVLDILRGNFSSAYTVTGKDLNNLTSEVQTHFLQVNDTQIKLIQQFGKVYKALEALDQYYIQWIIASLKTTEKATEEIKEDNIKINKLQSNQIKTLEKLQEFKLRIDSYKHLPDIDTLWEDCQQWRNDMLSLSALLSEVVTLSNTNKSNISTIWESFGRFQSSMESLCNDVSDAKSKIDTHSVQIAQLYEQNSATLNTVEENKLYADRSIAEANEKTSSMIQKLNKKITCAYLIAGSALAIAVAELFIILLR